MRGDTFGSRRISNTQEYLIKNLLIEKSNNLNLIESVRPQISSHSRKNDVAVFFLIFSLHAKAAKAVEANKKSSREA